MTLDYPLGVPVRNGSLADVGRTWEPSPMQVSVHQYGTVIGTAILEHLDPPMGIAFGPFLPLDHYDRDQHANTVEGHYIGDRGRSLLVHTEKHGRLDALIAIDDRADPKIGRQLTIWFQDSGHFDALFSTHEDYQTYYGR